MYEHLSPRVDRVMKLAQKIAKGYGLEYVGTEHVLLAISAEGTGLGVRILQDHGLDERKIKAAVDKLIQASLEDTWVFGRLPGTPHFRNVVALAIEQAEELQSKTVCTEHLLLALLLEKGCVAQETLRSLGLTAKIVKQDIQRLQAGDAC